MDEKDLQIFVALARTCNITKAAEELFMVQPTLSKRLQNMEQELDTTLFLRRSRQNMVLTPEGEELLEAAAQIQTIMQQLRETLQKKQKRVGGTLRMAASLDYSRYCLPLVLRQYATAFPEVNLQISTEHSRDCYKELLGAKQHIAIVRGEYPWDDGKIMLKSERICLIRSRQTVGQPLSGQRYISRYSDAGQMGLQARWLAENHLEPVSRINVDALDTCVSITQSGLGWSIVPEICLGDFDGIVEPLTFADGTPLVRGTYLLYRKQEYELPQVREFIRIACDCARQ